MTPSKQQYQAYVAATQTVAKTRQIVMLYDGAIRNLQQACEAVDEGRVEDRFHLLVKASDIISGLQGCLDFESGGDMASLLYNFYAQIELRIFAIHRQPTREACEQVIRELKSMRDVWAEIDDSMTNAQASMKTESASPPAGGGTTQSVTTVSAMPDAGSVVLSA